MNVENIICYQTLSQNANFEDTIRGSVYCITTVSSQIFIYSYYSCWENFYHNSVITIEYSRLWVLYIQGLQCNEDRTKEWEAIQCVKWCSYEITIAEKAEELI